MSKCNERNVTSSLGRPTNGIEHERFVRRVMQRRGWIAFHSRAGDKKRATDHIVRRIASNRRFNHAVLFIQTSVRYRDLDKVSQTLATWERFRRKKNPLAAWVYVEFELGRRHPKDAIESAVKEMEERFSRNLPKAGSFYCLLVSADGTCRWTDLVSYKGELETRRKNDLNGPRRTGFITQVNGAGITVRDSSGRRKFFVFYKQILQPERGSPPMPLVVDAPVSFVPEGQNIGRTPLARCLRVEKLSAG